MAAEHGRYGLSLYVEGFRVQCSLVFVDRLVSM